LSGQVKAAKPGIYAQDQSMSHPIIETLRTERPQFHAKGGDLTSWASQFEVLEFIADRFVAGATSLETGCGYSSVVFAATGWAHTAVTPMQSETERVAAWCNQKGVDLSRTSFAVGKSQDVLPTLGEGPPLDLVYIDGAHRFPYPCIDWVYTENRLKVGGLMMVDDVRIPSCRTLHDFLMRENNWALDRCLDDTTVFTKLADADYSTDWAVQSYNDGYPDWSFLPAHQRPGREGGIKGLLRRLLGR
jgi:predicted O-methyltransferase YrrM